MARLSGSAALTARQAPMKTIAAVVRLPNGPPFRRKPNRKMVRPAHLPGGVPVELQVLTGGDRGGVHAARRTDRTGSHLVRVDE